MLIGLTLSLTTLAVQADVHVIRSTIHGNGYTTTGNTISIISPTITLNGQKLELHTGEINARNACEILGLNYVSYDQGISNNTNRARIDENGSIEFIEGSRYLSVLNCRK
ncbi:MAG: hypothetical protein Q7U04_04880 [Bacteriovorax sp.]|nr:hypothetical protein [Bacteriovorax sp.]